MTAYAGSTAPKRLFYYQWRLWRLSCIIRFFSWKRQCRHFWRNVRHRLHRKFSFWQLPVQPVTKISSKMTTLPFNVVIFLRNFGHRLHRKFWQLSVQPVTKISLKVTTLNGSVLIFDEILVTGCTDSFRFDNFPCSRWPKFRKKSRHCRSGAEMIVPFIGWRSNRKHLVSMAARGVVQYKDANFTV